MPKKSPREIAARRRALIELLAGEEGCTIQDAVAKLRPKPGRRTIHTDLAWLKSSFPRHLVHQKAAPAGTGRIAYRWQGAIPHLLSEPITWLSEDELTVLVAAQGLLRNTYGPRIEGLSAVAEGLVKRAGVLEPAQHKQRHIVTVSRFGAAPISDPECLTTCLTATSTGEAISFEYTNLAGLKRRIHAAPLRLILIRGEWYCAAWAKGIGMYKLSRMAKVERSKLPSGMTHVPSRAVDDLLADSFYATGSTDPKRMVRVVLFVEPDVWPFLEGRTWGRNQKVQVTSDGWRHLSFSTAGLAECRHWVLSLGTGVWPQAPAELVNWVHTSASELAKRNLPEALARTPNFF